MKINITKCLIALTLAIFSLQLTAQVHVDNQWKNIINPYFENLDKSKIQSGILLDYAMEFTDVQAYNGVITDTTYIDANILGSIYKTLFMGKVVADTTHTPLFDKHAYNWARDRFNATKDSTGVYILSGLLYEYQTLDEDALAQNRITVSNNKYYDKYIGGVWQNPYHTKQTFALTPPILHSRSKEVYFKLPDELFLSNIGSQIASIQLDADNGQGYQNLSFDTTVPLQFYENKIHDITFKLTLADNSVLYCRSKFKIDDPTLKKKTQARSAIVVNDERVYIHEDGNFFSAAWLTIRRIPGNTEITRPIIIAEGLDTGNFTAPEDFGGETTLQNFNNSLANSGNLDNLIEIGTNDYDLIYIDWVRGMGDMIDNSRVLEEVLEWVNSQKVPVNGVTEQNVLLGQSMGGVIGRYTLARMENNNNTHDVRLFIAHDSPMQGANTLLAGQHFSAHMREEYVSNPLAWTAGEVLIPIGQGLAEMGSAFLNAFGANTSVPAYVTPSQLLSLQDQTASRQLSYWSVITDINNNHIQTRSFNQAWQQTLENEGWPTQSRNIAIGNGNECSVDNGFEPGAQLIDIDSRSNPGFLLDMLNAVLAPVIGAIDLDLGLVLVGVIPGRSRWETKFDFNTYGITGSQNRIYRGRLRFEKKILWIGPTIKYDVFNRSYYAPNTALPFDTYSGGRFEFFDNNGNFTFEDIPILGNLMEVEQDFYGFIPTVSALDIKKTNGNSPTPNDYLKSYSGGVPQDSNLVSSFDNFIVDNTPDQPFNNEHISFQVRNGNWLADELNGINSVLDDCSFICDNSAIAGPSTICSTFNSYLYIAPAGGDNYNWTILGNSAFLEAGSTPNTIKVKRMLSNSGWVTLRVNIMSTRCGDVVLEKDIYVGAPTVDSIIEIDPNTINHISSANGNCDDIGLQLNFAPNNQGVLEIEWEKITTDVMWSREFDNSNDRNVIIYPNCNKTFEFRVRARNTCGWSNWQNLSYEIDNCNSDCGNGQSSGNISSANFEIYPVPADTNLHVKVKALADGVIIPNLDFNVKLFNSAGIKVIDVNPNMSPANINVSSLPAGTYTIIITYQNITESHQIVIS